MYADTNTGKILGGFPSNIKATYDPLDPLHILIRATYASGLYELQYKQVRELNNRFPHMTSLTQTRSVYKAIGDKDWATPTVSCTLAGSTLFSLQQARNEEDFFYGTPTRLVQEQTAVTDFDAHEVGETIDGIVYVKNDSTVDGRLYILSSNSDDNGRLGYTSVSTLNGELTFGGLGNFTDFQYRAHNYTTDGFDEILVLQADDEDAGISPLGYPTTTYTAQLPHIYIRYDALDPTKRLVVYDILNLDANGNARQVPEDEYTVDLENGTITFNRFLDDDLVIARPSYNSGTQPDPGWNSTYIAEYQYCLYSQAKGLSGTTYLHDYAYLYNYGILAGLTPNILGTNSVTQTSFYDSDKIMAPRSEMLEGSSVTVSFFYTGRADYTWAGVPITLSDYIVYDKTELSTTYRDRLRLHSDVIGYRVLATLDGVERQLQPYDANTGDGDYTITGQVWGTTFGTLTIVNPEIPVDTAITLYYQSMYIYTTTAFSTYPDDYTTYEIVYDEAGRKIANFRTYISLETGTAYQATSLPLSALPLSAFALTISSSVRDGVAVDPYHHAVWTVENNMLCVYDDFGNKLDAYNPFASEYFDSSPYILTDANVPYPIELLNDSIPTITSVCYWRKFLLLLYNTDTETVIGFIDTTNPHRGIIGTAPLLDLANAPVLVSTVNDITIGPDDTLIIAQDTELIYFRLHYDYFLVDNNTIILREPLVTGTTLQVKDSSQTRNYSTEITKTDISTAIDNMLELMTLSRLPGMTNQDDAFRTSAKLKNTANSTRAGLINALHNEFALPINFAVTSKLIYTLSKQPITVNKVTGEYYPVTITSGDYAYGTQGANLADSHIGPLTMVAGDATHLNHLTLFGLYTNDDDATLLFTTATSKLYVSINGEAATELGSAVVGAEYAVTSGVYVRINETIDLADSWSADLRRTPGTAVRIYDIYGNTTGTWSWILWMDVAENYTRYLEFRTLPPHVSYTASVFMVTYWVEGSDGTIVEFTDTFYPKASRTTTQPVEIGILDIPTAFPHFQVFGLNNKVAMHALGYLDDQYRPTTKLYALVGRQGAISKLKWSNGRWDFTPWSNEFLQISGLEYLPAKFDANYTR